MRALVLTATFARSDAKLALAASIWQKLYQAGDHALLAEFLTHVALSVSAWDALTPSERADALRQLAVAIPPGTPEHTDLVARVDVSDDLAKIEVPTLVIATSGDPLVTPALQRDLVAAIPDARLAEIDTGHLPFAERPQQWLELMTGFLNETAAVA